MPELPEVETTVRGLNRFVKGRRIAGVWTDMYSEFHAGKPNIKDRRFFREFRRHVAGKKILRAGRRGKNVLLFLADGPVILVHMKMTGHLLFGVYRKRRVKRPGQAAWEPVRPETLKDPFNRFLHVVFTFSDGTHLVLSDLRKFAKVTLLDPSGLGRSPDLKDLGPEPLARGFTFEKFREALRRKPRGRIKQVLMDQNVIAGIGNIYSDEILWSAGVHPFERAGRIRPKKLALMWKAMREILRFSLRIGGDSESDYRDILGRPGRYQNAARAYAREGTPCTRPGCRGAIIRKKIGGRSAHFCNVHQRRSGSRPAPAPAAEEKAL